MNLSSLMKITSGMGQTSLANDAREYLLRSKADMKKLSGVSQTEDGTARSAR
jgi:hypothetical protein